MRAIIIALLVIISGINLNLDFSVSSATKNPQPPIRILIEIHNEDVTGIYNPRDALTTPYEKWYSRAKNLLWLLNFTSSFPKEKRPKLNIQFNGDVAEYYLFYKNNNTIAKKVLNKLKEMYINGDITLGTHPHVIVREGPLKWRVIPPEESGSDFNSGIDPLENPDALCDPNITLVVKALNDHTSMVDALIKYITGAKDVEKINNNMVGAWPVRFDNQRLAYLGLLTDGNITMIHGFPIETAARGEFFTDVFYQNPWSPWRPSDKGPLLEDLNYKGHVAIPIGAVLGSTGEHMYRWQDNKVPQKKKEFLQLYLERLYREYYGFDEKIWTFGWHEHPKNLFAEGEENFYLSLLRDELQDMINWLNENFIGKKDSLGCTIALYSNITEVYNEFLKWEKENPGKSSFEYNLSYPDIDSYPYLLKGLAKELANAHFVDFISVPIEGLKVAEFIVAPSAVRGEKEAYWHVLGNGEIVALDSTNESTGREVKLSTVYVLWSEKRMKIDIEKIVGDAILINGVTGEEYNMESTSIILEKAIPIIAKPCKNHSIKYFSNIEIKINFRKEYDEVNPLNGVQGGPAPIVKGGKDLRKEYEKFGIDAVRLFQDAEPATVYLSGIFPDKDADANLETSYNFSIIDSKIESAKDMEILWIAGYDIGKGGDFWVDGFVGGRAPLDAQKYANVVKHVLMHFNEGWANGYHYDIDKVEFINEGYGLGGFRSEEEFYKVYDAFYDAIKEYNKQYGKNVKIYAPDLPIGECYYATRAWQYIIHFIEHMIEENKICDVFSVHAYAYLPKDEKLLIMMLRELLNYYGLDIPIAVTEYQINDAWDIIPQEFTKNEVYRSAVAGSYDTAVKILWQGIVDECYLYRANDRPTPTGIAKGTLFANDIPLPCAYTFIPFKEMKNCKIAYIDNPLQDYIPAMAVVSEELKAVLISNFQPINISMHLNLDGKYNAKLYLIDANIKAWQPHQIFKGIRSIDYNIPPYSVVYIVFNQTISFNFIKILEFIISIIAFPINFLFLPFLSLYLMSIE